MNLSSPWLNLGKSVGLEILMTDVNDNIAPSAKLIFTRWSKKCAIGLYIMSAIWGGLQISFSEHAGLYLFSAICFALLATSWARYDSKARGISFLPILQMLYFLLWPIGATVYLIYRSGWRGVLTAGLHGIGMMFLMILTFYATFFGLHFAGLLDARYQPT